MLFSTTYFITSFVIVPIGVIFDLNFRIKMLENKSNSDKVTFFLFRSSKMQFDKT